MASVPASARASVRVATAVTAAVRIAVIADASRIAVGCPYPVEQGDHALVGVEPARRVSRHQADRLEGEGGAPSPPRSRAGISPISPSAPGARMTERSGM